MSQDTVAACVLLAGFLYVLVWGYVRDLKTRNEDLASDVEYYKRKDVETRLKLVEEATHSSRLEQRDQDERSGRLAVDREIVSVLQSIKDNLEHRTLKN